VAKDLFDSPEGAHEDEQGIKRDRWGRYIIPSLKPNLEQGQETYWTRVTTFAKSTADTAALTAWSERMAIKGVVMQPDLLVKAQATRIEDRDTLNEIAVKAKEAAGAHTAANYGTALHSMTEQVDEGESGDDFPEPWASRVRAYREAMDQAQVKILHHADRLMIEQVIVCKQFKVAGTFDRIVTGPRWEMPVIADLKTGRDLSYSWKEIAIQLAVYAHADAIWDYKAKEFLPMPEVDQKVALVMHLPVDGTGCDLYEVDIEAGWQAAELAHKVRRWRKYKGLQTLIHSVDSGIEAPAPLPISWVDRIAAAETADDLTNIFLQARAKGEWTDQLQQLGMQRKAEIEAGKI
jgi:hypothetical protein